MRLFIVAITALLAAWQVQANAVFAHFMVGNVPTWKASDWKSDIALAQEAHIDAFVLNIGYGDSTVANSVAQAFIAAEALGFELFFSFDYAGGTGTWPQADVLSYLKKYISSSAYYHYNGKPFVSTFEGTGNSADWYSIKAQTGCFFIPDWTSAGVSGALNLSPGVPDGLFNWGAWPSGPADMTTSVDASFISTLGSLAYMMPVSPWFFTNLPTWNKNWLWRGDDLWYDRWQQVLYLQPPFVEILTWNDYGESHYIGPLHDEEEGLFTSGQAPYNYVDGMPHDGWRLFLPFLIDTYKNNVSTITKEGLTSWYRLNPATACSTGGTTGNSASQGQAEYAPSAIMQDRIFYSALLGSSATVKVTIGGVSQTGTWSDTPSSGKGIYHGSVPFNGHTGAVTITISRSGTVIAQISGASITTNCNSGIENWNAWVGSATGGTIDTTVEYVDDHVCIAGTGADNFLGLCAFACGYGYCPTAACTCTSLGAQVTKPKSVAVVGHALAGESSAYEGLCNFTCGLGYCPSTACTSVAASVSQSTTSTSTTSRSTTSTSTTSRSTTSTSTATTSTASPSSSVGCIAGVGQDNLGGLCSYSCGYGYCPTNACTCTATGTLLSSPATIGVGGAAAPGLDTTLYNGLCNFTCSRGYCPSGACISVPLSTSTTSTSTASTRTSSTSTSSTSTVSTRTTSTSSTSTSTRTTSTSSSSTSPTSTRTTSTSSSSTSPTSTRTTSTSSSSASPTSTRATSTSSSSTSTTSTRATSTSSSSTSSSSTSSSSTSSSSTSSSSTSSSSTSSSSTSSSSTSSSSTSTTSTTSTASSSPSVGCIAGVGDGNLGGLCAYSCGLGYCPTSSCTCTAQGTLVNPPATIGVIGYAAPGLSAALYDGLCNFTCSRGYCPPGACTQSVSCAAGVGQGNLGGLCGYSCNYGYCPTNACTCTSQGTSATPPAIVAGSGYAAPGLDSNVYGGLCNFTCSRGYCPSGACTY